MLSFIILAVIAFLPAFAWLALWYFKDSKDKEPKKALAYAFVFGAVVPLPFAFFSWQLQSYEIFVRSWEWFSGLLFSVPFWILLIVLALLEEALKHFAAMATGTKYKIFFDQIIDGVMYSVAAALGFAWMENILYLLVAFDYYGIQSTVFWQTYFFRSLGTMLAHSLFSAVFGLFWGHAFLSAAVSPKHNYSVKAFFSRIPKRFWQTITLHIIRRHILIARPSTRGHERADVVLEGLYLATLLHSMFNFLLEMNGLMVLIGPFLLLLFLFISHQFLVPKNIKIWKPVQ